MTMAVTASHRKQFDACIISIAFDDGQRLRQLCNKLHARLVCWALNGRFADALTNRNIPLLTICRCID